MEFFYFIIIITIIIIIIIIIIFSLIITFAKVRNCLPFSCFLNPLKVSGNWF